MTEAWYPGIKRFCAHWQHAPMLQHTFVTMEQEFAEGQDACIDAAKAIVECACRTLIDELDDPAAPLKPTEADPPLAKLLGTATRLLDLGEVRDRAFANLIREHNKLSEALRVLRNEAGTLSHGKDAFIEKLSAHHRRAALLAADAIVTFLHEAYLEREPDPARTLEPYDRFARTNDLVDKHTSLSAAVDDDGVLQVIVALPTGDGVEVSVLASELLFGVDRQAYKQAANASRDAEAVLANAGADHSELA
ncbi:abortive infection family protein [Bauldia sp.]|uniref:abortive infection family protein n=1 Tax=Bauldia sp. TaxID=2575872 RepID=UPI003BA87BC6